MGIQKVQRLVLREDRPTLHPGVYLPCDFAIFQPQLRNWTSRTTSVLKSTILKTQLPKLNLYLTLRPRCVSFVGAILFTGVVFPFRDTSLSGTHARAHSRARATGLVAPHLRLHRLLDGHAVAAAHHPGAHRNPFRGNRFGFPW